MKKLTAAVLVAGTPAELADLHYASGFAAVDPSVYIRYGRSACLVVPLMERGRAVREAHRGIRVLTPRDLPIRKADQHRLSGWCLGAARIVRARRVEVSPFFPLAVARRLEKSGIRVATAKGPLLPERAVKTAAEIRAIARVQSAAVKAMQAAMRMVCRARADGRGVLRLAGRTLTAEMVRAEIDRVLLGCDCITAGTIVACGPASADPHERGRGPLHAGRPIVIDIFPRSRASGYWGDLTRTVVKGRAPATLRRMYTAVRRAHEAALRGVRAGATGAQVHRCAQEVFARTGFATTVRDGTPEGFIHSTGHGVGLDIHEGPSVSASGGRLQAGNVVTIEPGLYYPNIGGVRIEDTVVVTRAGVRVLARLPTKLEI